MSEFFASNNFVNRLATPEGEPNGASWDGSPITLQPNEKIQLQSTNGDIIIAYQNVDAKNNAGQLAISYGGTEPVFKDADPLLNAPNILIEDYNGNVVQFTNISSQAPITVIAYGPGFGTSQELPANGLFYALEQYQSRETVTSTSYQRLVFQAEKSYTVFAQFVAGTPKVYCVNSPDPSTVPVEDYTFVTQANSYPVTANNLGKTLYVINLSPDVSQGAMVSLSTL